MEDRFVSKGCEHYFVRICGTDAALLLAVREHEGEAEKAEKATSFELRRDVLPVSWLRLSRHSRWSPASKGRGGCLIWTSGVTEG